MAQFHRLSQLGAHQRLLGRALALRLGLVFHLQVHRVGGAQLHDGAVGLLRRLVALRSDVSLQREAHLLELVVQSCVPALLSGRACAKRLGEAPLQARAHVGVGLEQQACLRVLLPAGESVGLGVAEVGVHAAEAERALPARVGAPLGAELQQRGRVVARVAHQVERLAFAP